MGGCLLVVVGGGSNLRRPEVLLHRDIHAAEHLGQEEITAGTVQRRLGLLVPSGRALLAETRRGGAGGGGIGSLRDNSGDGDRLLRPVHQRLPRQHRRRCGRGSREPLHDGGGSQLGRVEGGVEGSGRVVVVVLFQPWEANSTALRSR